MGVWRARSPVTDQLEGNTCWAHALESWTFATHGVADETADEPIQRFFALGCVTRSGALSPSRALPHLRRIDGLRNEVIHNRNDITSAHIQHTLKRGLALIAYTHGTLGSAPALSHCVVVYGADKFSLCVMDPLTNPGSALPGGYWCQKVSDFRRDLSKATLLYR
jgi:hypothetical protein